LKTKAEIDALIAEHDKAPHLRIVQKALAEDITVRTHSREDYETAIRTSEFLFGGGSLEFLNGLNHEGVLDVFDGIPQFTLSKNDLVAGIPVLDLFAVQSSVFPSKGEARKMIQGGGVSINKEKLIDVEEVVTADRLINGKYLIAQRGKKNYYLIIAE
jgi:tyrosyl-tRNA synthetase